MLLWCHPDDDISNPVYWMGWNSYEPEASELFFRLAKDCSTVIDVGAYIGLYSLLAAHANPSGKVYAFEPMPKAFERLSQNAQLNRLSNIQCVNTALGEKIGTAQLFSSTDFPTISGLHAGFVQSWGKTTYTSVSVDTLDCFVERHHIDRVDLVKMDTETTESEVLRGMIKTLDRDRPTLFCEVHSNAINERALTEILTPFGYKYYHLVPEGATLRGNIQGHPRWYNYLFSCLEPSELNRFGKVTTL